MFAKECLNKCSMWTYLLFVRRYPCSWQEKDEFPPQLFRKMTLLKRYCLCKMTFWGYPEPAAVQAPLCFRRCKKVCPWEDGAIRLETLHEISRGLLVVYWRSIFIIISNWFALPLEKRLRWPTFGRAKNRFSKDCARFRSWFSEARYPL